jgi:hypothetical protein
MCVNRAESATIRSVGSDGSDGSLAFRFWRATTGSCSSFILRPDAAEPFVGWVQPTAGPLELVGCTHPTMTRSLPLAGSLQPWLRSVRKTLGSPRHRGSARRNEWPSACVACVACVAESHNRLLHNRLRKQHRAGDATRVRRGSPSCVAVGPRRLASNGPKRASQHMRHVRHEIGEAEHPDWITTILMNTTSGTRTSEASAPADRSWYRLLNPLAFGAGSVARV